MRNLRRSFFYLSLLAWFGSQTISAVTIHFSTEPNALYYEIQWLIQAELKDELEFIDIIHTSPINKDQEPKFRFFRIRAIDKENTPGFWSEIYSIENKAIVIVQEEKQKERLLHKENTKEEITNQEKEKINANNLNEEKGKKNERESNQQKENETNTLIKKEITTKEKQQITDSKEKQEKKFLEQDTSTQKKNSNTFESTSGGKVIEFAKVQIMPPFYHIGQKYWAGSSSSIIFIGSENQRIQAVFFRLSRENESTKPEFIEIKATELKTSQMQIAIKSIADKLEAEMLLEFYIMNVNGAKTELKQIPLNVDTRAPRITETRNPQLLSVSFEDLSVPIQLKIQNNGKVLREITVYNLIQFSQEDLEKFGPGATMEFTDSAGNSASHLLNK